jgi:outer membrane PBP1 activator LpoA protein
MKLKIIVACCVLAATSALAAAQPAPPSVPKPTKADVQKIVQIISGDKAKTQLYCQLSALDDQMAAADEKKDEKALEKLGKQAEDLATKIGPEYVKLMQGLDQVDPNSAEGKAFGALMEPLDKLCTK